jgi:acetyl-CoA acetyltransferase
MTDACVLGGVRTPVGRYGGSLSHLRVDDLLGQTMVWACERVGVRWIGSRTSPGLRECRAREDGARRALGGAPFMPRGPVLRLDTMWAGAGGPPNPNLLARDSCIEMMRTAQNVADRYELTREEIDAFAGRSLRATPRRSTTARAPPCSPPEPLPRSSACSRWRAW